MLHKSTFEYLQPTEYQKQCMAVVRKAAAVYAEVIDKNIPEGPDKTTILRNHRTNAMWANVAITRLPDGTPRDDSATTE
jgi:hypothetical protein